jgi:GT2 family glycosyltransferase
MSKVSIIMPVYNGAKYIAEAINSAFAQTYKDWELIVVDDGSTDDTEEIVVSLGLPLKFIKQQNCGPSAARNLGLQAATGTYIVFLDADDEWDHDFLEKTASQLDRLDESVAAVCSGWLYIDKEGQELPHTRMSRDGYLGLEDFLINNPFPLHAILTRKELLLSVHGFDSQILAMEDWDLWLRLLGTGRRFYAIRSPFAKYRLHGLSNSREPDRMRRGRLHALEKLFARADLLADMQALKPRILGRALTQSSVEFFAVGRDREALRDFCEAIQVCPELFEDDEVFYAIICAQQPVGYKGTGEFLDLESGERRLVDSIRAALSTSDVPDTKLSSQVYGRAYLVLSRLAYSQRRMDLTRHYMYLALKHDATLIRNGNVLKLGAKSLLGPKWLDMLKRLRDGNVVKTN